jgi:hypothetical protein
MLREELQSIPQTDREVRKFGVTLGVVLVLLAVFLFWKEKPSANYFALAAALFAGVTWMRPRLVRPVYLAWMAFAAVMGFVMTRVILTALYFGMFTPMALLARLFGKDLLHQRIDKSAASYWIKRERRAYEPQASERMF